MVGVWKGRFFRLEEHLKRFERAWKALKMSPSIDLPSIRQVLFECVRRSGLREAYVEMIVTRGVPQAGSRDPRTYDNCFYAYAIPYVWIQSIEKQKKGGHLIIARDTIRIPESSVDPTVKNFHWADLTRGLLEAYDRGGEYVVLPNQKGCLTEGPGFNVFTVYRNELWTPPSGVLEGITRKTVIELARNEGISTRVEDLSIELARSSDEIFATSTAGGVMPMTVLDGISIGKGLPGRLTQLLHKRYWEAHEDDRFSSKVDYN